MTSLEEVLRVVEGQGLTTPDAFHPVMPTMPVPYSMGHFAVD